jgi:peptide-methionine (R)-S-oxide reductase
MGEEFLKTRVFGGFMFDGKKIERSDAEWKRILSKEEYEVLRRGGTEPAFSNEYFDCKKEGVYECAACHLPLFSSGDKYDSGTGWPSFTRPIMRENVGYKEDSKLSQQRVEVFCPRCGSHLGHVFEDGPLPTGLRYCMNSRSLNLKMTA